MLQEKYDNWEQKRILTHTEERQKDYINQGFGFIASLSGSTLSLFFSRGKNLCADIKLTIKNHGKSGNVEMSGNMKKKYEKWT